MADAHGISISNRSTWNSQDAVRKHAHREGLLPPATTILEFVRERLQDMGILDIGVAPRRRYA